MAAVEITISGVLYDKYNRTQQNVVLIGEASLTDAQVGGGPVLPPSGGAPGRPTHPIWGPPGSNFPGGPGSGYPPVAGHPLPLPPPTVWPPGPGIELPEHPIVIPPPVDPDKPPIEPGTIIEWKLIWSSDDGWQVVGVPNVPHPAPSK